jgi:hypothetical protein
VVGGGNQRHSLVRDVLYDDHGYAERALAARLVRKPFSLSELAIAGLIR